MALQYTLRPISDRTPFLGKHTTSLFTVSWSYVLNLLQREYDMLNGRHLVIEVDVRERDIRNDGLLRADARSSSPAVRIAFDSKHGPLIYATDQFVANSYRSSKMDHWQHNVYAIAKSLEALRMVDRYGVSRRGEQYTGWKALPSGSGVVATSMTTDEALVVLAKYAHVSPIIFSGRQDLHEFARRAKSVTHPDRNDGDRTDWNKVETAIGVLRRSGRSI